MSYTVSTPPASEPVLASDFRAFHLHVDDSTEESGLDELVVAVRQYLERRYDKAIVTQTITEKYMNWARCIDLTISPVQSISSVKYYDDDDNIQTLSSAKYTLVKARTHGYISFNDDMNYPTLSTDRSEPIEVTYVAGDATVPGHIKQHIRQCVARMYYDKEAFESVMRNVEMIFPELRIVV